MKRCKLSGEQKATPKLEGKKIKALVAKETMNLEVSAIYLEKKKTQKRNIRVENHVSRKLFFSVSGKLK